MNNNFNLVSYFKNQFKIFINEFLDLIYKRKCINCGCSIPVDILCETCAKTVQNLPPFPQDKINNFEVFCGFYYEGVIKNLIQQLKFKHNKNCAIYAAKYLYDFIKQIKLENKNLDFNNAIIIPVITHKKNYNKRGYDNVLEISKQLALLCDFELNSEVLIKTKYTKPQYQMTFKQRQKNIIGSFLLDKNFKTDKLIIVLDDILTTGSTLNYITSLFKEQGFKNLICLTLSKTNFNKKVL